MAVATARAGNVIGGGDWSEWIVSYPMQFSAWNGRQGAVRKAAVGPCGPGNMCWSRSRGYLRLAELLVAGPNATGGIQLRS